MKKNSIPFILLSIFLLSIFMLSPLSSLANGGQIWSYGGYNSYIKSDLVVTKGKPINVTFSAEFSTYIKGDFYLYIVPFYNFAVGGDYFDSVYGYASLNYLYMAKVSQNTTSLQIDSTLIFDYSGNYVIYALNPSENRGASWNFIYSDAFSLNKNLTAGDYYFHLINHKSSSYGDEFSFTVNANNFLNLNRDFEWDIESTNYGSTTITMEDIKIKDIKGKPLLLAFDDFSISKYNGDNLQRCTYIIYLTLVDSKTAMPYPLGIIDNMHGGSPGSPYYFLLDSNLFNHLDNFSVFTLELSFRIYAVENAAGNLFNLNISNFRLASVTYGNTSTQSDIVSALNDPSFGSFDDPFDDSKIDASSGQLEDSVGDYSDLENDLMSSSDVDVDYYGNPLDSLTDSFSWWSQALSSIYVGVPLLEPVIGLCVTVGLFAVIVGIIGRSISHEKNSKYSKKSNNYKNKSKKGG